MVLHSDWLLGTYGVVAYIDMYDCVAFCHSEPFLLICIAVTAGWCHFILLFHSLFLIIWPWVLPICCYTLLILTRLLYGGLILLIIVLFTILSHLLFSLCLFYSSLSFILFFRFYWSFFFSFGTDWRWVSVLLMPLGIEGCRDFWMILSVFSNLQTMSFGLNASYQHFISSIKNYIASNTDFPSPLLSFVIRPVV